MMLLNSGDGSYPSVGSRSSSRPTERARQETATARLLQDISPESAETVYALMNNCEIYYTNNAVYAVINNRGILIHWQCYGCRRGRSDLFACLTFLSRYIAVITLLSCAIIILDCLIVFELYRREI